MGANLMEPPLPGLFLGDFQRWGIHCGTGPRVRAKDLAEFYTLPEIWNTWTPNLYSRNAVGKAKSPKRISLLRVGKDMRGNVWGSCWSKQVQKKSWQWWGPYKGLEAVEQMC